MEKQELTHVEHREDFENIDETELLTSQEKSRLRWKLDLRLLPICWILYFVNRAFTSHDVLHWLTL